MRNLSSRPALARWARSTAWMTAARLVKMVAGVVLFGSLARALEPASFGLWSLVIATWGLAETVRGGASSSAYLRFAAQCRPEDQPRFTGALVQLMGLGTALLAAVAGIGAHLVAGELRVLLLGVTGLVVASALMEVVHVLLQSRRAFGGLFLQQAVQALASLAASAWLLSGGDHPMEAALLGLAGGYLLGAIVPLPALRGIPVVFRNTRAPMEQLFQHGRYAASSRAGSALHRSLDLWLVATLLGAEAVAAYAVAWRLADYSEVLLQPVVKVLVPEISERGASPRRAAHLAGRAVVVMTGAIALVSAPMALFPSWSVWLLAGEGYGGAGPVLLVLVGFNLLRPVDRCTGVYLDAIGRPELNARKVALALVVNAALTVVALGIGGPVALPLVAVASVVASLAGTAVAEAALARAGLPSLLRASADVIRKGRSQALASGGVRVD